VTSGVLRRAYRNTCPACCKPLAAYSAVIGLQAGCKHVCTLLTTSRPQALACCKPIAANGLQQALARVTLVTDDGLKQIVNCDPFKMVRDKR